MKLKAAAIAVLLSLSLLLSGCGDAPVTWKLGEKTAFSLGTETMNEHELMLVALIYKTEYEHYYSSLLGEHFWERKVSSGITYEKFIKESCIFAECKALMYLAEIAKKEDIFISEYEEKDIKEAAQIIWNSMTQDEKDYTGADFEDVNSLLRRYYLADRTIEALMKGEEQEISDEESRVCDIEVLRVSNENLARNLYERIKEGENFQTIAKENTLDPQISYSVSRQDLNEVLSELVFSMSDGEISQIIYFNDSYYIIRMAGSYNSLQSLNNKRNILAELRYKSWQDKYEEYENQIQIRRNDNIFNGIRLEKEGDFPKIDFFFMFNN